MRKLLSLFFVFLAVVPCLAQQKPRVRAITAFVNLDQAQYQQQIEQTLAFLRGAKAALEKRGYEVQSVRITTQPFPELVRGLTREQALVWLRSYDQLAQKEDFDTSLGPAMLADSDSAAPAMLMAEALTGAKVLEGSIIIAGQDGIHWKAIAAAAQVIKYLEEHSPHSQANFNFSATAMLQPLAPFYPGSYHTGAGHQFSIGLQSANVITESFEGGSATNWEAVSARLQQRLGRFAQEIEATAQAVAAQTGWSYAGLDLSPAPLKDVSIGAAIENLTHARFGSSGTMSAVAAITAALKAIPVKQAGYSGLMLPILEDSLLARRWAEGAVSVDALLAYSAVCGTGLDTVPLPGDISVEQLQRMLTDVASLARKWNKPLSARLLPVAGKKAGDRTEFDDPFLVNTKLQPLP